eukprot:s4655_g6.t1
MGCGTSTPQDIKPVAQPEEKEEEPETWASKPSQADRPRPAVSTAAAKDPGGNASTVEAATGSGSLHKPVEHSVMVMDPDDDVEVIYEGKGTSTARDVLETREMEAEDGQTDIDLALDAITAEDEPKPVLSKQQQEEAAKMAEHRKRFDNQRYQRGQSGSGDTGPGAAPVPAISLGNQETKAPHEIMGVNASAALTPRQASLEECLPGGILDDLPGEQTVAPPRAHRNNHFDDDDEMLMKDILDSIDG